MGLVAGIATAKVKAEGTRKCDDFIVIRNEAIPPEVVEVIAYVCIFYKV